MQSSIAQLATIGFTTVLPDHSNTDHVAINSLVFVCEQAMHKALHMRQLREIIIMQRIHMLL